MEKKIDKLTAIAFLLVAIISAALFAKNINNLSGIVFLAISAFGSLAAYVVNEESNEI